MQHEINNAEQNVNQKHIKETYSDKAQNLLKICIGLMVLSLLSYLIALAYNTFDFGLIFEIVTFAFIILAYSQINQLKIKSAKKSIVIAMIPIGWLIIYDLIDLIVNIGDVIPVVMRYFLSIDQFFYYLQPYLFDTVLVATIILLYKAFSSLSRADNTKPADDYVDSFYDKL